MRYRIGVDIGGTFTDCAVTDEEGTSTVSKSLTTPRSLSDGVLDAVRINAEDRGRSLGELLAVTDQFVHGTTQATNAMLTRSGARTGLITTRGHEDNLLIGRVYAKMAGLHERDLVHSSRLAKPEPIVPRELIRGVTERMDRHGDVVVALNEAEVLVAIDSLVASGVQALAVSFLWSFVNERHERRVKELVGQRAPEIFSAYSFEVAPVIGEYERTATTAVTAYVGPKVVAYLERLERRLRDEGLAHPLLVMQASGGLTSVTDAAARPIVTLDSGPTGGILGSRELGALYGERNVICTDVGGTSFDVGLILDGEVPLDAEPVVAQYSLRMPKVLVHTIGAGGGSIAWIDEGGLLRVGPQSAGSAPGPACYGFGGTRATVTDADLVLGYLDPVGFLGGRMRLDRELALQALGQLGRELGLEAEEVAIGVFRIINSQMADLIRKTTIELGHDPRDCVIAAYGGAGPTHAVFYGHEAGTKAILIPPESTVFSAAGMLTCDISHTADSTQPHVGPLAGEQFAQIRERLELLHRRLAEQFAAEGADPKTITYTRLLGVRFQSQANEFNIEVDQELLDPEHPDGLRERFLERYAHIFGSGAILPGAEIDVDLHRVVGTRAVKHLARKGHELTGEDPEAAQRSSRRVYFERLGYVSTPVYDGYALAPGNLVIGPAIIVRMGDSVVVPPGHQARTDEYLTLRLTAVRAPSGSPSYDTAPISETHP
jgi:N-methylhydantoinase A